MKPEVKDNLQKIYKSKVFWIIVGGILILFLFWSLGGVNAGIGIAKRVILEREQAITEKLEERLKETEDKVKVSEEKRKQLEYRISAQETKLKAIKAENEKLLKEITDVKKRISNITVPTDPVGIADEFRKRGLKSATPAPRPR